MFVGAAGEDALQADNTNSVAAMAASAASVFAVFILVISLLVAGDVGPVQFDALVNQQ